MNTDYAKEFLVFSESLNYSEAARDLFISRSTLRDHIQELEFELKVPLIDKAEDGIRLTVYGKHFIGKARELCHYTEDMVREFEDLKNNYLNVRVSYSTLSWLRMQLLRARMNVSAAHPEKTIEITTMGSPAISRSALDDGAFDLVVLRADRGLDPKDHPELFGGLAFEKVASARILLFTGVENPLAKKEHLTLDDLRGQTLLVSSDLYREYRQHGDVAGVFGMELSTLDFNDFLEYYMADYSHCIGTVPDILVDQYALKDRVDCVFLDVEGFSLASDFYLACREDFLENPTAALLFDELRRLIRESAR